MDEVVSFDEDLPQSTLADGIILGIELVEAMERISVLKMIHIYREMIYKI